MEYYVYFEILINCKIVVLRVSVAWFQIKGRIPALISGRNLFHFEAPFGSAPNRNCQGEYVFCSVSCCALTPPQKVFRSSPYGPDPQVSARPRTEGGWVQNPLLNARVATFAFKAFVTISCRRPGAGTAHRQQPPQKTFARAGSQADRIRC